MPSVRFGLLKENEFLPSMVLGAHDFMWAFGGTQAIHFNALYMVASKHLHLDTFLCKIGIHLGYGTDWMKAAHHEFVGLFAGVSLCPSKYIAFMFEHDAEKFNGGLRITVLDHVQLLVAFLDFDTFFAGLSYRFFL